MGIDAILLSAADSTRALLDLNRMRIRVDSITEHLKLPELARAYRLTVYDAAYLELAIRKRLPLATLDKALRAAAEAAGATLLG